MAVMVAVMSIHLLNYIGENNMSNFIMSGAQYTSFIAGIGASKKKETLFEGLAMAAAYQSLRYGNFDAPRRAMAVTPAYAKDWFANLEEACKAHAKECKNKKNGNCFEGLSPEQVETVVTGIVEDAVMAPFADRVALKTAEKEAKKAAEKDKVFITQGENQMELTPEEASAVLDLIREMRNGVVGAQGADMQHNALKVVNAA